MPLGPNYLPSYAGGVLAGLKELGPKLIGKDPTQIKVINRFMDYELKGHPYVKSPIDMACWDILGKVGTMISYISNYDRGRFSSLQHQNHTYNALYLIISGLWFACGDAAWRMPTRKHFTLQGYKPRNT